MEWSEELCGVGRWPNQFRNHRPKIINLAGEDQAKRREGNNQQMRAGGTQRSSGGLPAGASEVAIERRATSLRTSTRSLEKETHVSLVASERERVTFRLWRAH